MIMRSVIYEQEQGREEADERIVPGARIRYRLICAVMDRCRVPDFGFFKWDSLHVPRAPS